MILATSMAALWEHGSLQIAEVPPAADAAPLAPLGHATHVGGEKLRGLTAEEVKVRYHHALPSGAWRTLSTPVLLLCRMSLQGTCKKGNTL
jgi:hypothetical protein